MESRVENIKESKKKDDKKEYETIGWVKVQGTNIDFAVLGDHDVSDEIPVNLKNFAYNLENKEKLLNKVNIMGHNILNLSSTPKVNSKNSTRFEDLMSFVYYDFAKKNKYIQYTVDGKDYLYKIYAVDFVESYTINIYPKGNLHDFELNQYIKDYKENSLYNYNIDVNENDKLISLMTCTRFYGDGYYSFVVNGRLVRDNEKIDNYKVEESKKYKEVKKILKGDEKNDEV